MLYFGKTTVAQQMVEVPLKYNLTVIDHIKANPVNNSRNNQVCPNDTLLIPFFDDFSNFTSVFPSCTNWQDNHVFINAEMAYNPPSIGVATFEGLKFNGTPYNVSASVSTGSPADTLTSQFINLGGKIASDQIYLSFFYQPQGLCDRPEVQDSFILEFKDTSNTWVLIWSAPGISNSVSTLELINFKQQYVAIDSANFLYNGFQFRFRNLASISGSNDHWHLDYVMLNQNRFNNADTLNPNYGRYADVAFTHRPTTPLKNGYTAMPWRHFIGDTCWADSIIIQNFNHNDAAGISTLDRLCVVSEINPNTSSLVIEGIPALQYFPSTVPDVLDQDSLNHKLVTPFNVFNPTQKTILETTYTILSPSGFQSDLMFFSNDTVKTQTVLDNYFAYDDGTAETRVIAQGLGTKIAVEYTAEVDDTIQGIYFHLPYFTNQNAQQDVINVKVWLDDLSTEVFSRDLHRLQYVYGFNGFYFVDLLDFSEQKILIPVQAGQKFYVGWQQSFGTEVPVGFDRSTDSRSRTFVGTGVSWDTATIKGSVMIRPVLSPDSNYTLIPIDLVEEPINQLTIFPNPTEDILNLKLQNYDRVDDYVIRIYNTMGQEVYSAVFTKQLNVHDWETGLYVLTLSNQKGKQIAEQKIIKH